MRDDRPTVPCAICRQPTPMIGTRRCDRCWELEQRIEQAPEIAATILERVRARQPRTYPYPCPACGDFALDGYITCGRVECTEALAAGARWRRP